MKESHDKPDRETSPTLLSTPHFERHTYCSQTRAIEQTILLKTSRQKRERRNTFHSKEEEDEKKDEVENESEVKLTRIVTHEKERFER